MKAKIKTQDFIHLLAKSIKGASSNKLLPITSLLGIKVEKTNLSLYTTDGNNYLRVKGFCISDDTFSVVVPATKFAVLISKMTCEKVILELTDAGLEIIGNGRYMIELPVDENGEPVVYPDPIQSFSTVSENGGVIYDVDLAMLKSNLAPSLAKTLEVPCYCNYYFGTITIATDTYKIAASQDSLFNNILLSPELINLVSISESKSVDYDINGNDILFTADDITVFGHLAEGIDEYAVDTITQLINADYAYKCAVSRADMIHALERASLFVDTYDKNLVELRFTERNIELNSRKADCAEFIEYAEDTETVIDDEFTCLIDVVMLLEQIKAYSDETLKIQFGDDSSIKLISNHKVTQILALSTE